MKKITQQSIADILGISRITVSKALNGSVGITSKMREIVLDKAMELGYTLTPRIDSARLSNNPRKVISLLTYKNFSADSYWGPVISGIVMALSEQQYDMSFCFLELLDEERYILPKNFDLLNSKGLIVMGNFSHTHMESFLKIGLPMVSVDTIASVVQTGLLTDTIMSSNSWPMKRLTAHLIEQGHVDIRFITNNESRLGFIERLRGYETAMKVSDLRPIHSYVKNLADIESLLVMRSLPTAFCCSNDATAIMLMQCLQKKGLKIPQDVSVSGFDNLSEATVLGLTTVDVPKTTLGIRAGEVIINRIHNPDKPMEIVRIMASPLFRETTGPVSWRTKADL